MFEKSEENLIIFDLVVSDENLFEKKLEDGHEDKQTDDAR